MPTSSPSCTLVVIQTEAERRAEEAERRIEELEGLLVKERERRQWAEDIATRRGA